MINVIVLGVILASWMVGICIDHWIIFGHERGFWDLGSSGGDIVFSHHVYANIPPHSNGLHFSTTVYGFYFGNGVWGTIRRGFNARFSFHAWIKPAPKDGSQNIVSSLSVTFPIWIAMFPPGIGVAVGIYRRKVARNRIHAGLCLNCGYDLRATPNQCPECGTIQD